MILRCAGIHLVSHERAWGSTQGTVAQSPTDVIRKMRLVQSSLPSNKRSCKGGKFCSRSSAGARCSSPGPAHTLDAEDVVAEGEHLHRAPLGGRQHARSRRGFQHLWQGSRFKRTWRIECAKSGCQVIGQDCPALPRFSCLSVPVGLKVASTPALHSRKRRVCVRTENSLLIWACWSGFRVYHLVPMHRVDADLPRDRGCSCAGFASVPANWRRRLHKRFLQVYTR